MDKQAIPPLDLMFFLSESPQNPKHVGAVQVFEMPAKAAPDYLQKLVAKLKAQQPVAPFSYTPKFPRMGMPYWQGSAEIDMDYHVRHSALPRPGDNSQLMAVIQRLHSTVLDRRRPCWTCQVIEGLEGNRFAIYSKIHHAYIDGMSGVKRMYGALSTSPRDRKVRASWAWQPPRRKAGKHDVKTEHHRGEQLVAQARGALEASGLLAKMALQWLKLRDSDMQPIFAARRTLLNQPVEWETRSTAICTLPLDRIKRLGKARDCTVNEVVLTLIGGALDDYLSERGQAPRSPLVALCPVSLRSEKDHDARTQASAVHVRLGDHGVSPSRRLAQVISSSRASKAEISAMSSAAMMDFGVAIFGLMELLERTGMDRFVAPTYNVLVSNVPGPGDQDLYLCGSRMVASYPISVLLPQVNLNITLLSHGNALDFGLLGDHHALPDLSQVAEALESQLAALEKAVKQRNRAAGRTTRARA